MGLAVVYILAIASVCRVVKLQDCQSVAADVVFAVDDSSSVQESNFGLVLSFVVQVVSTLTIGPNAVQVSFLSFSDTVFNQFWLNEYPDVDSLVNKIESIKYRGGGTDINKALVAAYTYNFSPSRGARTGVLRVLVLITDGQSSGAEATALEMRNDGIRFLCLGIIPEANLTLLTTLAGSSSRVYYALTFYSLPAIPMETISAAICEVTSVSSCDSKPCKNGGTCVVSGTAFSCQCPATFTGTICDQATSITPCDSQPCRNNGTCVPSGTSYRCECPAAFIGSVCDQDVDECRDGTSGCSQMCTNTDGSFICSCVLGYSLNATNRKSCDDFDECTRDTDGCEHNCENLVGGYSCNCRQGYTLNADSRTCADVDECQIGATNCSQTCINIAGSFICACNLGYTLNATDKKSCHDVDECRDGISGCSQMCTNTAGSFICSCGQGFSLDATNKKLCQDVDECTLDTDGCEQNCENLVGGYSCDCRQGYMLNDDSRTCDDIDECAIEDCGKNGQCWDGIGAFLCVCHDGYTGRFCEITENSEQIDNTPIIAVIAGATGGAVVFIVLVVAGIVIYQRRAISRPNIDNHYTTPNTPEIEESVYDALDNAAGAAETDTSYEIPHNVHF